MKLIIEIEMDNEAFENLPGVEISRILRKFAYNIKLDEIEPKDQWLLLDFNGNRVGTARIEG